MKKDKFASQEPFKAKVGDVEHEFVIRKPTLHDIREADKVRNTAFADAILAKALVRPRLDDFLREQGLWNDEKQVKLTGIKEELFECERVLNRGGIRKSAGKEVALKMIRLRAEFNSLLSIRSQFDNNTAEGQADNARFNYLVSACLVYKDTGKPYFSSLEDYLTNIEDEVGQLGARQLGYIMYELDNNYQSKLTEFKFLKEFKFVDDKLRLINKDGHLVDVDGKLINEDGYYVNEKEELVDRDGNRVDKDGNLLVVRKPFLDDDDNEIVEEVAPVVAAEPVVEVTEEVKPVTEEVK